MLLEEFSCQIQPLAVVILSFFPYAVANCNTISVNSYCVCTGCTKLFHLHCLHPPLEAKPSDPWFHSDQCKQLFLSNTLKVETNKSAVLLDTTSNPSYDIVDPISVHGPL